MKNTIVAVAVLATLAAGRAWSQSAPSAERQLMDLVQRYNDAQVKRDRRTLEQLWADDYLYTHSNGAVMNKAQDIADTMSGDMTWTAARLDDIARLIIDVRLPGTSGLDLQRQLLAAKRELPMIFISAHDDPVARRQALTAGALAFLRKPFSEKALIEAVRALSQGGRRSNP